jgi:hypothetical protein
LLVIINAFVGGMAGLERSILPQIEEVEFHITARTAILSFIIVSGIVSTYQLFHRDVGKKNFTMANKQTQRNNKQ